MSKIFLAINYLSEGWSLDEYPSIEEAIEGIYSGETHGNEWKLLREIKLTPEEE